MPITPCRDKWSGTMTDRERFNAQMHYQPFDRCFNMEFGYWDENFIQWPIFFKNGITNNEEADIFFNFDRQFSISGNIWLSPVFSEEVVEVRENTKVLINSDGLLAEVPLDGHDTIPHFIKSSIETPDDWAKVKADMDKQDAFANQKVINETARAYLASTDWMVVRAAEGGTAVPSDVTTKRAAERAKVVDYADFSA